MNHPYYDREKKYTMMKVRYYFLAMLVIFGLGIIFIPMVINWENENAEPYWQEYQVVYSGQEPRQVILYNKDDLQDSIVIRTVPGSAELMPQAVEILKYKLP